MHVSTLKTQIGLGLKPVVWYRDATYVPYGQLLIDLLPRIDDRLRHCTNTGSIPSEFTISNPLKQSELLDDEHTKFFYSPNVPNSLPQMQQSFASVSKEIIRLLCGCIVNLLKWNLQSRKRHHVTKCQNEVRLFSPERINWRQRRDVMASEKRLQLIKVITPLVINHFPWYGAVCFRPWFCVLQQQQQQQEFEISGSYKSGASKVSR